MKARFKKIDLLTHRGDRDRITSMLQELGVLHLEFDKDFRNANIEELERRRSRLIKAVEFIGESKDRKSKVLSTSVLRDKPVDTLVDEILNLKNRKEACYQEREILRKNIQKLTPWGEFDHERMLKLTEAGIHVAFYIVEKKEYKKEQFDELTYQIVHKGPDHLYLVVLSKDESIALPYERVQLPPVKMSDAIVQENELTSDRDEIVKQAQSYLPYLASLSEELIKLDDHWMLQMAFGSYKEYGEGTILYLKGWFPANMEDRLRHFIDKEQLSYIVSDPAPGEVVPVLLKNPKYPKLFEAITNIFQLPGYYEMDLTPFIAVFYPILFAYCLGDAGYGMILLFASILGSFTFLKKSGNMAFLGIILGLFTTLMGIVKSGSAFGIPLVDSQSIPFLAYLSQYVVIPDDRSVIFNAFNVALMIGVVHIFVGIIISIVNKNRYHSYHQSYLESVKDYTSIIRYHHGLGQIC
ncbi:MAG: V-type ATPase 116kDa subunit family protein, partial [Bacteroidota bacterium]